MSYIDNATLQNVLNKIIGGSVGVLANNHLGYAINIPITGADVLNHAYKWQFDSIDVFEIVADGDGAGGIKYPGIIVPKGYCAFGSGASLGTANSTFKIWHFEEDVADFTADLQYPFYGRANIKPTGNLTGATIAAFEFTLDVPASNSFDIDAYNFSAFEGIWNNNGSGDINIGFGLLSSAFHSGSGNITSELVAGYFYSANNSSGNIPGTSQKDGNFGVAVGTANYGSGYIARNFHFYAESPYGTGEIKNNWGLYLENQEIGTESSYAIQTAGGKVQFGAPTGKNSMIYMDTADVAHGMTSIVPTNVYADITSISSTAGGLQLLGLSDVDSSAIKLLGIIGSPTPTSTTPALLLSGAKKNGASSQNLASGDLLLEIDNNSTNVFSMYGNGDVKQTGVLKLQNSATPPASSVDMVQLYGVDISAGNASLGLFTETALVTETALADRTLSIKHNGTTVKLLIKS